MFLTDTMFNIKVLILFSEPTLFFAGTVYNIKMLILKLILFSEPIIFFTDTVYNIKVLTLFSGSIMFFTEIQCTTLKCLFYFHGISCVVVRYVIKVLILFLGPTISFTDTVYNIKVLICIFRIYHVFCWGISLVLSLLPFINDHYGPAGAWW